MQGYKRYCRRACQQSDASAARTERLHALVPQVAARHDVDPQLLHLVVAAEALRPAAGAVGAPDSRKHGAENGVAAAQQCQPAGGDAAPTAAASQDRTGSGAAAMPHGPAADAGCAATAPAQPAACPGDLAGGAATTSPAQGPATPSRDGLEERHIEAGALGHATAVPACEVGKASKEPPPKGERAGTHPAPDSAAALPVARSADPPGLAEEAEMCTPQRDQSGQGSPANGHAQRRPASRPAADGGAGGGGDAGQRLDAGPKLGTEALGTLPLLRCGLADVAALETHWAKAAPEWRGAVGAACAELAAAAAAAGGYAPSTPAQLQVRHVCSLMLDMSGTTNQRHEAKIGCAMGLACAHLHHVCTHLGLIV